MQSLSSHCIRDFRTVVFDQQLLSAAYLPRKIKPQRVKYAFDINTYFTHSDGRQRVENFIKEGYIKAFNADVSVTMPALLAIKNGSFKAALGIRSALSSLFIEQYLNSTIEHAINRDLGKINRSKIAEIGNLYSNTPKFALPLLLTAGIALFSNQYQVISFCATSQVQAMIEHTGIKLYTISTADQNKLNHSNDDWGSYYNTSPKVVAISVSDIVKTIADTPRYLKMFGQLAPRISDIAIQMSERMS